MAIDVQIALQAQAAQDPEVALAAAAMRLARFTLQALAQQLGQSLAGKVLAATNLPQGYTQIAAGSDILTFRLSSPLPAGLPVTIDVAAGTDARLPQVTIQPAQVQAQPSANPSSTASPVVRVAEVPARPDVPMPMPAASQPQSQSDATVPNRPASAATYTTVARPAPAAPVAPTASAPVVAPVVESAGTAPVAQTNTQPGPDMARAVPAPAQPAPAGGPAPVPAVTVQATGPQPVPAAQVVVADAPEVVMPTPASPATPQATPAAVAPASAPQTVAPTVPTPTGTPPLAAPAPAPAALPQAPVTLPAAPSVIASAAPPTSSPVVPSKLETAAPPPASVTPAPPPPVAPPHAMLQRLTQAFAAPPTVAPASAAPPPTPEMAATLAQAAARQQSAAPLIDTLARQLPSLPPPVAEAAARVLAGRLSLDRGAPSGEALKSAVMRAGVLLAPQARPGEPPDLKVALTQLKTALLGFLGGEVEAVAPVARRPPPPARGAAPRAFTPDAPPQTGGDNRETAKSLLGQTDGALARLKLLQLTSHGNDAARPGAAVAAPAEWNLELPLLLGRELAMAQIQISRDGKQKSEERERSWRLRFALKFSVLGEVGAQVAMVGKRASVALWADETLTAETLEAMLPELAPALAAKGLELTSLTVRRGAPRDEARPMGQLMDSRR